tara:strand:- start:1709 stop:2395 length:687 start_codon:yes stop_codon:yes gene_type:complete
MEKQFINAMRSIDWQPAVDIRNVGYLKDSVNPDSGWWDTAIKHLPDLPHDANILDIGTWFGVLPRVLKEIGYTNVECTECSVHTIGVNEDLEKLHRLFNIHPFEFEVIPSKEFVLPKQYDLITILHTNMHWKINDVYCLAKDPELGGQLTKNWQITVGSKTYTFFTPWNLKDWQIFIKCIKQYLKPGGTCVMQPHPWPYYYPSETPIHEFLNPYIVDGGLESTTLCIK